MKEFDKYSSDPAVSKSGIAAEQRQVKTEKRLNSMSMHPGHECWEFDLATGIAAPAKIETVTAQQDNRYKGVINIRRTVIQREDCLYCSALNKKNAIRKFVKMYDALVKAGAIIRPK